MSWRKQRYVQVTVRAPLWLTPPYEDTQHNVGFEKGMMVEISELQQPQVNEKSNA